MKRAKIALSAVAILTTVGGLFAFKAAHFNSLAYYTGTTSKSCVLTTNISTTSAIHGSKVFFKTAVYGTTVTVTTSCPSQAYTIAGGDQF